MNDDLILVDDDDNIVGYADKLRVHQEGLLHRAFSLFIMNKNNELMLQKRASNKYHSAGLWAYTCCSHPFKGEVQKQAIHNRIMFVMGFDCMLSELFRFTYYAELDHGMIEYELDRVYYGNYEGKPTPNPEEVSDWRWMNIEALKKDLEDHPDQYVYWLKEAFDEFYEKIKVAENNK
jgi:isopentenyl-diphosphate delta-isomerase